MILLPQGRKILIIAASLFIATFSLALFVVSGAHPGNSSDLKVSVFEEFFHHKESTSEHDAQKELPALTLDASGIVLDVHASFEKDFGYSQYDLKGKPFFNLIDSEDLSLFASEYVKVVSSGSVAINNGPYHFIAADGTRRLILVTYSPAQDSKKHLKSMVLTIRDITESESNDSLKPAKGKAIKDLDEENAGKNKIIVEKTG